MKKQKVLLAIQSRDLEEMLEKGLSSEFDFVGIVSYREILMEKISQTNPDILLIREALPGTKNIVKLIYEVRMKYSNVRIVFMTGRRQPGDLILTELVRYGVYDLLLGQKVTKNDMFDIIRHPRTMKDVSHLLPSPELDESNTEPAFEVKTHVVEVPVYIERTQTEVPEVVSAPEPVSIPNPIRKAPPIAQPIPEAEPVQEPAKPMEVEPEAEEFFEEPPAPEPKKTKARGVIPLPGQRKKKPALKGQEETSIVPAEKTATVVEPEPFYPPATMEQSKQKSKKEKKEIALDFNPMEMAKKKSLSNYPPAQLGAPQSKQIITFVGAVHGVGNTQVAFNTAVKLANDGSKVIFLENNSLFSTIDFAFQLGEYNLGLDKALMEISDGNTRDIQKSIHSMQKKKEMAKGNAALQKIYKKLPDNLDFLFYSQDYQTLIHKPEIKKEYLKDLCMYLLLQEGYDYVVVDSEPIGTPAGGIEELLSISSKVYLTLTQDAAQVGHLSRHLSDIEKRINLKDKLYIVLNKFISVEPDERQLNEWLNLPIAVVIPETTKDFVSANYLGVPFVLHSRNKETQQVFEVLRNKVIEK